jgi:tyrosine-specific transport protein
MHSRFVGGILLIIGTSIGGGMLALPIANSSSGFLSSSLALIICWFLMTIGALYILEVNLYFPPGHNMVSMAANTLGKGGLLLTWVIYLLLLYTLLAAYISGGADVLGGVLSKISLILSPWVLILVFTLIFGLIVYSGIRSVDWFNRFLMFAKLGIYSLLAILIAPFIQKHHLMGGNYHLVQGSIMVLITSFGFSIIVPSLREYFNDDIPALRRVIFIGSLIPLFCYILWDAIIMGSLTSSGEQGLTHLMKSAHSTSELANLLSLRVNNVLISTLFQFFTSICMLTAFLGVSLCLMDFLGDGLKLGKSGKEGWILFLISYLPPVFIVLLYPGAYMYTLNYAGYFCIILLLLLPALMSFWGRKKYSASYQVPGGKLFQFFTVTVSCIMLWFGR